MTKSDLNDSNSKKLTDSKDDNYDICNNICFDSQIKNNNLKEDSNENYKLKEQINKEIEDMYQLSLKNSRKINSNKKTNNKYNQKELIQPLEKNENFFEEDEFKKSNTEFI